MYWEAPSETPVDYRVSWAKSSDDYLTWTDLTGNAFPTIPSYNITDLDEDTEYKLIIRTRYNDGYSGPRTDDIIIRTGITPPDLEPVVPTNSTVPTTTTPIPTLPTITPLQTNTTETYIVLPVAGSGVPGCESTLAGCSIPNELTIPLGEAVTFNNTDNVAHTWLSGHASDDDGGVVFNSGLVLPSQTYEWTPITAGNQQWFCIVHPWIMWNIIVVSSDTSESITSTNSTIPDPIVITDNIAPTQTANITTQIIDLQSRLNDAITEMNRLTSLIIQIQAELSTLITTLS